MPKTGYSLTSPQLFFGVLCYTLAGLFLDTEREIFGVLVACTLVSLLSAFAYFYTAGHTCSRTFYDDMFGRISGAVRLFLAFVTALTLVRKLGGFSASVAYDYGGEPEMTFIFLLFLAVLALWGSYSRAVRFFELSVLPLAALIIVSAFGGGGKLYAHIGASVFTGAFSAVGSALVVLSLYLRTARSREEMSAYQKSSDFHPSALVCGMSAPFAAGIIYILAELLGFSSENMLASFFLWFILLAGVFTVMLSLSDILAIPEMAADGNARCGYVALALVFSAAMLFFSYAGAETSAAVESALSLAVLITVSVSAGRLFAAEGGE